VGLRVQNKKNSQTLMDDKFFDNENSYLTFSLGTEIYGVSIKNISEIIGIQDITKVPGMPKFISGIINLRGQIVPVMDLRAKFEKPPIEYNERTCIIIIEIENIFLGLIVDIVLEVVKISEDKITLSPNITTYESNYIDGIGQYNGNVALLLNGEKLLTRADIDNLKEN
jgi:purine-binding chemotaxis protein CheW